MAITLVSSTPAEGETDYFINKSIELTFNKDIASSSLSGNIFSIIDTDSGTSVPITITAGHSTSTKVILLPSVNLRENTQYRIIIVGTTEGYEYALTAEDTETLSTTIVVEFATGSTVYKVDTIVEKTAANLTLEGELFLPTNIKALGFDFTVDKVRPKNNKHGLGVTLTGDLTVRFTFTKALYTGSIDFTEWADVSLFPLLNDTNYLAEGTTLPGGAIPDYTVSVTGQDLLVTFASELPKNLGIQIHLLDGIASEDGDEYGGKMIYSVNTQLFPEVYGLETIKREVREVIQTFTDDYIGALVFKNSIWLWEKLGRSFALDAIPFAGKQHIIYSTILDLMEDREYYKYVVAGTRRQLGDMGVSIDSLIGRIAMKVAKYQQAKEVAFESLVAGWQFKVGSYCVYDALAATINRLWFDINGRYTDTMYVYQQDDIPATNVALNRRAKTNNPIW